MNPIILEIQKPKQNLEQTNKWTLEKQQYEEKMKLMQKKMKSMESQLASAKQASAMGPGKASQTQKPGQNPKNEKKKTGGCCGGGSCSLM